jgi:hypothetical protein
MPLKPLARRARPANYDTRPVGARNGGYGRDRAGGIPAFFLKPHYDRSDDLSVKSLNFAPGRRMVKPWRIGTLTG